MDAFQIGQILFYIALLSTIFLPLRFALISYVIMCNIDSPGIGNIIKILIVPLLLLFRFHLKEKKTQKQRESKTTLKIAAPYLLWGLFATYATIATTWTELGNYIAGVKFVLNLVGILLSYFIFKRANAHGLLNNHFITAVIVSSLALGFIQTYILDSDYGSQLSRFTGFLASQLYAAFLAGSLALVVWNNQYKIWSKLSLSVLLLTGLTLNTSRTWIIGACIVLFIYAFFKMSKNSLHMSVVFFALFIVSTCLIIFYSFAMDNKESLEKNRLFQGFYALVGDEHERSTGTFGFRESMNAGMIYEIKHSTQLQLFFGHGTSSTEYVARKYQYNHYRDGFVDANRVAHNEWLRITYEFGIVGMLLWVGFLLSCFFYLVSKGYQIMPIISYGGALLVALTTENVIAGAGTLGLCGFMILLGSKQKRKLAVNQIDSESPSKLVNLNTLTARVEFH